ncbi:MFS transporter [Oleomonas cavernae]|nr:MFS transporter [Oleomonas cavernae]
MASWLAMAIALVLVAVGLGLAGFAASLYLRYRAMTAWPMVPGQVAITGLDAERRLHRHAARLVHIPTVAYRYSVAGEDQIGSRLSNIPTLFEHEDEAKAFLARFPEGTALKVRYNPAAPRTRSSSRARRRSRPSSLAPWRRWARPPGCCWHNRSARAKRGAITRGAPVTGVSERRIILVVGAIQFVNIVDFMMVMPLGPDYAVGLGIDPAHLGYVAAAYTVAACLAGLLGAFVLDRFPRRLALTVALGGLGLGTMAGSIAVDLGSLIGARVIAGAFGGPATALAMSVLADHIPEARRGRAMGAVMGAFALAAVLGVPAGLEMARLGGWRLPFLVVGCAALVTAAFAWVALPRGGRPAAARSWRGLLRRREHLLAFAAVGFANLQSFMIIPSITAFLIFNLGYPRDGLSVLYLLGGSLSLVGMRLTGRLVDRLGTTNVNVVATAALSALLVTCFVVVPLPLPVIVLFPLFMLIMSARNVATQTLMTKVPPPAERAGFMSLLSATQHLAASAGAGLSSAMLSTGAGGALLGVPGWPGRR